MHANAHALAIVSVQALLLGGSDCVFSRSVTSSAILSHIGSLRIMLSGFLVTTVWRVLMLRMERSLQR
jgi:hypothetical protein